MRNEPNSNDMREIWQNQTQETTKMSPQELRNMAEALPKTVRCRNFMEYVAAAFVLAINGYFIWKFQTMLLRLGAGLTIAGVLYVVYHLHKKGAARPAPTEAALNPCLDFYRRELERQRDLLRKIWTWYLLPIFPGLILFLVGLFQFAAEQPSAQSRQGFIALMFGVVAVVCSGVFVLVGKLNEWAARKLQIQIDRLDVLSKES